MVLKSLHKLCFFFIPLIAFSTINYGQSVNHWETLVFNDDLWHYSLGNNSILANWKDPVYDASHWQEGPGGFGYGDNDDNTLLQNTLSVFFRKEFDIIDTSNIAHYLLHADYDDAFVAYLNGVEIARNNIGSPNVQPAYYNGANTQHEASLYQDDIPETYPIKSKSLFRNGQNTIAIQVHNTDLSSSDLSSNFFLSAGIKDNSSDYRSPPDWFHKVIFNSTLPLVKITTSNDAEILDDPKIDAHMGIINNGQNQSNSIYDAFSDYDGSIGIEIRGTSSQIYDKKGYDIETRNADGSNNNVELLGMPEENDWALYGPYSDKSLLRNVFTYHIGRLTGQYAPRTKFCELFINEEYMGIYVLTEEIKQDKNRVDIANLTEEDNSGDELTGGYIIKVDRNPDNIPGKGWYSTFPDNRFFAYVEPKAKDITDAQKTYIQQYMYFFELAMAQSSYAETLQDYIDLNSWIDYFLITEVSKQIDAYKLSFYMYKDKQSNGGKLHMGPLWDFNLAYGNFDFACSPDPEGWAYEFPLCGSWHPFWPKKIAEIPMVQHQTNCRWQELRSGPLQTDLLLEYIDGQVEELGDAIDRNFDRWPVLGVYVWANDFIGDTYEEEMNFIKNWLVSRLEWMDQNMVGDCEQFTSSSDPLLESKISIFPNPASDFIRVNNLPTNPNSLNIDIFDSQGRLIKSEPVSALGNHIALYDIPNGFYILTLKEGVEIIDRATFVKNSSN